MQAALSSKTLVKILSSSVALFFVILVGLLISGLKKDE